MAAAARCTPDSVSAHMLYENSNPTLLQEPGGTLDVRDAAYRALSDRRVRIEGSRWLPSPSYRVKLEGAGPAGYQTTALVMLRSERYVANAEAWANRLGEFLEREIPLRTDSIPEPSPLNSASSESTPRWANSKPRGTCPMRSAYCSLPPRGPRKGPPRSRSWQIRSCCIFRCRNARSCRHSPFRFHRRSRSADRHSSFCSTM